MKWKSLLLGGLLMVPVVLSGCWDRREINDVAFVLASGFDKEKDQYRVSVQVPLPSQLGGIGGSGGGGGTSGDKSWYVESMTGSTIREANEKQQRSLSRQLYFAHRRVLLIGDEAAREGVKEYLDILARVPQNRLGTFVLITKGETRDVMNAEESIEQTPAEMMRELAQNTMRKPRTAKHFIETLLSDGIDPYAPAIQVVKTQSGSGKEKTTIKVIGLAVFSKGKLQGILNPEESQGALIAMNQAVQPMINLPAPKGEGQLSILLGETNVNIKPALEGDKIKMRIVVRGKGSLIENTSAYDVTAGHNMEDTEKRLDESLKQSLQKSIDMLRMKLHADPIGFGDIVYRKFPNEWQTMKKDWQSHYEVMQVEIIPEIHIVHTGAITQPFGYKEGDLKQ
ncbi:Ger(x)C family spore germination protein [Tumebacillus permanentifrigoris]|uniref:Spore germination protein KC n=1 Tax=Tumebacillus permanentifrigoris TaxID=378543 RepID=A0A316DYW6_9BACL|nr:Ger(x)C family spore germination protein [Tumebacillus permanentifrigoris]PWK15690.1 spore germination protein KC [Tumebacillus permanentifrigoris]